jgi:hypothetical protein
LIVIRKKKVQVIVSVEVVKTGQIEIESKTRKKLKQNNKTKTIRSSDSKKVGRIEKGLRAF